MLFFALFSVPPFHYQCLCVFLASVFQQHTLLSAFSSFKEQRCIVLVLTLIWSTMMNKWFSYPADDGLVQDSSHLLTLSYSDVSSLPAGQRCRDYFN